MANTLSITSSLRKDTICVITISLKQYDSFIHTIHTTKNFFLTHFDLNLAIVSGNQLACFLARLTLYRAQAYKCQNIDKSRYFYPNFTLDHICYACTKIAAKSWKLYNKSKQYMFYKLYCTPASLISQITQIYTPLIDGSLKVTVNVLRATSNSSRQDVDFSDTFAT